MAARRGAAGRRRPRRCNLRDSRDLRPLRVGVGGRVTLLVREVVYVALAIELHKRRYRRGIDCICVLRLRAGVRRRRVVFDVDHVRRGAVVGDERERLLHALALEERRRLAVSGWERVAARGRV